MKRNFFGLLSVFFGVACGNDAPQGANAPPPLSRDAAKRGLSAMSSAYRNSPILGTYNCIPSGTIVAHFEDRRHIVQFDRCTHGDHIIDGPLFVNFPGGGKPTEYDGSLTFHPDQTAACHISLLADSGHSTGTFCGWDPEDLNKKDYQDK